MKGEVVVKTSDSRKCLNMSLEARVKSGQDCTWWYTLVKYLLQQVAELKETVKML